MSLRGIFAAACGTAIALAACTDLPRAPRDADAPLSRPAPFDETQPERSEVSLDLEAYFNRTQSGLLTRGLLRTDGGGPDAPYTSRTLVTNFEQLGLFQEYTTVAGKLIARKTPGVVHKWQVPVRIEPVFGTTVSPEKAIRDRTAITSYADRLARLTNHPIRAVSTGGNFKILILHEDERRRIGPLLREEIPSISQAVVSRVENLPRTTYCIVFAASPKDDGVYTRAIAVIRAEHPDLLRLSCIHEEIAQGLGLANDSPNARPSIFNDDDEFALLTSQDELLLRILYDRRLTPGMTADVARPVVEQIARGLLPAGL